MLLRCYLIHVTIILRHILCLVYLCPFKVLVYLCHTSDLFIICSLFVTVINHIGDSNGTQTHNHLVRKQTLKWLNVLAKWLSVCLQTKWSWVQVQLQSLKTSDIVPVLRRTFLTFRQLKSMDSL